MASKTKATRRRKRRRRRKPRTTAPTARLLDLSDAAVSKMIKPAKKRGYVTHDAAQRVLPSEEVTSEQIEDTFAMLNEMGINVVEQEEAERGRARGRGRGRRAEGGELVEVSRQAARRQAEKKEPSERTDDPVRMYLREMGSVELLSREGEIAIAKRIEAGREAMIAGPCESPLTFQAIIIWRDELNEGKVFLRDIIDLEATYAGPTPRHAGRRAGPHGEPLPRRRRRPARRRSPQRRPPRPPARRRSRPPRSVAARRRRASRADEGEAGARSPNADLDDDDFENSLSLAAIEAELKPKVLETFDTRRRQLQEAAPPAGPGHRDKLQERRRSRRRRSASTRSSRKRSSPR